MWIYFWISGEGGYAGYSAGPADVTQIDFPNKIIFTYRPLRRNLQADLNGCVVQAEMNGATSTDQPGMRPFPALSTTGAILCGRVAQIDLLCAIPPAGKAYTVPGAVPVEKDCLPNVAGAFSPASPHRLRWLANHVELASSAWNDLESALWRGNLTWRKQNCEMGLGNTRRVCFSLAIHHLRLRCKTSPVYRCIPDAAAGRGILDRRPGASGGRACHGCHGRSVRPSCAPADFRSGRRYGCLRFLQPGGMELFPLPGSHGYALPFERHLRWLEAAGYRDLNVYWVYAGHAIWGGRRPASG